MDVKLGTGAFMTDRAAAHDLARSIVDVATEAGLPTRALVTDMNMCLGHSAGNALEIVEAIDILCGRAVAGRLVEVTLCLAAELLDMAGFSGGRARAEAALGSGRAAERFGRMVGLLGGPDDLLDHPHRYLPGAPIVRAVTAGSSGHVQAIDARAIGLAVIELGGGRRHADHTIRHDVGFTDLVETGTAVEGDTVLGTVHARDEASADAAVIAVKRAFELGPDQPEAMPLIVDRLIRESSGSLPDRNGRRSSSERPDVWRP